MVIGEDLEKNWSQPQRACQGHDQCNNLFYSNIINKKIVVPCDFSIAETDRCNIGIYVPGSCSPGVKGGG